MKYEHTVYSDQYSSFSILPCGTSPEIREMMLCSSQSYFTFFTEIIFKNPTSSSDQSTVHAIVMLTIALTIYTVPTLSDTSFCGHVQFAKSIARDERSRVSIGLY